MNQQTLPESVIIQLATLTDSDRDLIQKCRRSHNRLGFSYQLMFVKVFNRFPSQEPLSIQQQILLFASMQVNISIDEIGIYQNRRQTISEHQEEIRIYLELFRFDQEAIDKVNHFLFEEAQRNEHMSILLAKVERFLKENKIFQPSQDTLKRLIITQRQQARHFIYEKVLFSLTDAHRTKLDDLLCVDATRLSKLHQLKQPPAYPSPKAFLALVSKLNIIQSFDIQRLDIDWLNNNYQRSLAKYVLRCSADRLKELQASFRYTALICFLKQLNWDTIDHIIDMHHKLILKVCNRAQNQLDEALHKQHRHFKQAQILLVAIANILLDDKVEDQNLRQVIFDSVSQEELANLTLSSQAWLSGKLSHVFHLVIERFSYLRQFSPALLASLEFEAIGDKASSLLEGIHLLNQLNQKQQRKLPQEVPIDFIPKNLLNFILSRGELNKPAWECALLVSIRDEIRSGNLTVKGSKRFGSFDNFFMDAKKWEIIRSDFFKQAKLPENPKEARNHLIQRLNQSYDNFLIKLGGNKFAKIEQDQWVLSVDPAETLTETETLSLSTLKSWLSKHMRSIKLPQLLIEVDNDLHYTKEFMLPHQQDSRKVEDVCSILVSLMAHGCFIGPYTMARLTEGISYEQIRRITDWQLTEEAQRVALALIVNAITNLDISQYWGNGKTSSSDGQRFKFKRKSLHQTYSTKFGDFALEFYTFVADNYAPYYSVSIECTDRDASYVLDGILYNESELAIEEHYTDSHGYTEINFAAFAMLGKTFSPRIRDVKNQRIYRIDKKRDYGCLTPLVSSHERLINLDLVEDQWDRTGHFYASLASGHTTASTALKRLAGFSPKNHFYRANRELGRIFKTENILNYMVDPQLRQNRRRGLLKGEQIHQLARDVAYGKRGKINIRDLQEQKNTCSCLTLILACIIYWQAKEIKRVIDTHGHELDKSCIDMVSHISPIGWDNIVLYGEYVLDRNLIK